MPQVVVLLTCKTNVDKKAIKKRYINIIIINSQVT